MTQVLELLTIKAGLLKTMLTVFKHNTKAVTFFKEASSHNTQKDVLIQHVAVFQGLKYSLDETSPVDTIQVKPILTIKRFIKVYDSYNESISRSNLTTKS